MSNQQLKFWHELTDAEYQQLKESKVTFSEIRQQYCQPEWCALKGALDFWGCWSLVSGSIKDNASCQKCEFYKYQKQNHELQHLQ